MGIGRAAAVPSKGGEALFRPGPGATLAVSAGLAAAAMCGLSLAGLVAAPLDQSVSQVGGGALALVFGIRAIGDLRFVGFFKRVRGTRFAYWDNVLYSPLCLALSVGFAALVVNS